MRRGFNIEKSRCTIFSRVGGRLFACVACKRCKCKQRFSSASTKGKPLGLTNWKIYFGKKQQDTVWPFPATVDPVFRMLAVRSASWRDAHRCPRTERLPRSYPLCLSSRLSPQSRAYLKVKANKKRASSLRSSTQENAKELKSNSMQLSCATSLI